MKKNKNKFYDNSFFNRPNSLEHFRNINRQKFQSLSEREIKIVSLVALGVDNSAISHQIKILPEEVKKYRADIRKKLSIKSRADFAKYALAFGLISF